jgi:hypothetical protein
MEKIVKIQDDYKKAPSNISFKKQVQEKTLDVSLQREFEGEMKSYTLNKKIMNLISDMGFIIKDH